MKSESKSLLTAQTEKPNHYSYLKEFRVEQCPLFLQHKCTQHRPFTCFHWHFMNQRRRRPVRRRDGTFNYSADNYCTKFDETTGVCPEGDECPYLHRTAGDTERRYHLRYYKTGMCVHDTDTRGFCVKNGPHCAFAHGSHDLRPAVYDIKELQALENPDSDANAISNGPNVLDKERNLMNEDPKWQDTSYVLANYKTELCKRPPRLCRQGYACPQYHNSKDKRRSPRKYKYRSTPCPNVKHGDEWGEPGNCDSGDQCPYCHTRTEQQFHPEIYKSTKCNDVQTAGYCPRGVFCAFAHVEQEMNLARDLAACVDSGMNLADILSSALPSEKRDSTCQDSSKRDEKSSDSSNGSGEVSESASTSSLGSNSSHSKAPGSQLQHHKNGSHHTFGSIGNNHHENDIRKHIMEIDSDPLLNPLEKAQKKQSIYLAHSINTSTSLGSAVSPLALPFYDTVESVVGNALEDISLDDPLNLAVTLDKELETESPTISNSISAGLASSGMLGSSAPVNIPGSALNERNSIGNFSPSTSSPLQQLQSSFLSTTRFSHQDSLDSGSTFLNPSHIQLSSSTSKIGSFTSGSLFDFSHPNMSPSNCANQHSSSSILNSFSLSSSVGANLEVQRLCEELATCKSQLASWEERIAQARTACEAWQHEAEESTRKANIAEKQRDEALSQAKALQKEVDLLQGSPYLHGLRRVSELKTLSLSTLKSLQAQLRSDLEEIEKVIYLQTATKCMVCEEGVRSVTLNPCNHYVLCSKCATTQKECPYCQTPVT